MGKKVIEIPTSLGVEFRKNISEYSDDFLKRKYDASGISSIRKAIKEELSKPPKTDYDMDWDKDEIPF